MCTPLPNLPDCPTRQLGVLNRAQNISGMANCSMRYARPWTSELSFSVQRTTSVPSSAAAPLTSRTFFVATDRITKYPAGKPRPSAPASCSRVELKGSGVYIGGCGGGAFIVSSAGQRAAVWFALHSPSSVRPVIRVPRRRSQDASSLRCHWYATFCQLRQDLAACYRPGGFLAPTVAHDNILMDGGIDCLVDCWLKTTVQVKFTFYCLTAFER